MNFSPLAIIANWIHSNVTKLQIQYFLYIISNELEFFCQISVVHWFCQWTIEWTEINILIDRWIEKIVLTNHFLCIFFRTHHFIAISNILNYSNKKYILNCVGIAWNFCSVSLDRFRCIYFNRIIWLLCISFFNP